MKTINVKFLDWPYPTNDDNTILQIIESKFKIEFSENPDFIIYSDFGKEHLKYNCIRVYYTPENIVPDFNICDYAIGYHEIIFEDRYIRFPLYGLFKYRNHYNMALHKHILTDSEIYRKSKFCNFIYSNSQANKIREDFFQFLSQYKKIDSGGRFMNNIGGPVDDKVDFQRNYKFSIAFENTSATSITSEKIIQAFAAQTIPIYWGDPAIGTYFNEKAFINVHKYKSFDEVLARIIEVENNPELFASMLREPMLVNKDLDYDKLESFLVNIIEKGPNEFRRSNTLRGKWYQEYQKRAAKRESFYSKWSSRASRYLPFSKLLKHK